MVEDQIEGSNSNTVTNSRLDDRFIAGKEHSPKARKPYTITKQREKWTQEEHGKFLEALKLYGRSWRHIKDHVGNKTAIQIRSHAQKFFSKVVRASSGTDETEILAIDIPPPRAKRKPMHPYPRKVSGPFEKRAGPVKSTCHDSSRSEHDILSPSWPECVLTQSLKLFGKTFFVTGSTKLPWNSMPNLAPVCTSICGLSGCVDLENQSSDPIEPMTQCFPQDGKNEVGNKGERYAKGFVPYKRCLEQDSSMLTGEDREELRVSLCL